MQDIRLIGLDLDGTVFDDKKQISPRTLAAIAAAIAQGVVVLPATGRPAAGVPAEFLGMPGVRYALTSNGATVTELSTGAHLVELTFPLPMALEVYDLLSGYDSILDLFIDGKSYTTPASAARLEAFAPPELLPYLRKSRITVPDMRALIAQHPHGVEKFSILYGDTALREAAWAAVTAKLPVEVTASFPNNMEINAPGVTKGQGLLALARRLGLRDDQVMACGDSGNDVAMLKAAGLGVAMANGTPEAKAAADVLTLDNNHDGVAVAIETYVLKP
ncbi:MAG: Cof-type HAD-IIB family hydrolase [Gemmiger sp.]|nr:Cof-type HAD-IIB family hydrolase [Gemmiger sp.]